MFPAIPNTQQRRRVNNFTRFINERLNQPIENRRQITLNRIISANLLELEIY
jgi:hypothetical protein